MKILLTGAFGYLGGRVADWLRVRGEEMILCGRNVPEPARSWASQYEVRLADVLDAGAIRQAARGVEVAVHLASLDERESEKDPDLALRVMEHGTRHLLDACKREHVSRVVFLSTFHVYGRGGGEVISEELPPAPRHPYAVAHLAGERLCTADRDLTALVIRLSNGYGCPAWRGVDRWSLAHNDFCRQAAQDGRIVLRSAGTAHRDFVWLDDAAQAVWLLLTTPNERLEHRVFNIGGRCSMPVIALAERVRAVAERRIGGLIPIEHPLGSSRWEPAVDFRVDRIARLGYAPRDAINDETERWFDLLLRSKEPDQ